MAEYTKRIKKAINWLIFNDIAENERALAELMGYTKSSFSQIVNGKVPLSQNFINKLRSFDENINEDYIVNGCGSFLVQDNIISENCVTIPKKAFDVIQSQAESLSSRDRQIETIIELLREQLYEMKKMIAPMVGNAVSADAV